MEHDTGPDSGLWLDERQFMMRVGWNDNLPHLSREEIQAQWRVTPPYLRKARAFGIPVAGEHRIYPVESEQLHCKPFRIPDEWPRVFALDPGFRMTAVLWAACDVDSETWYLYSEYKRGQKPPAVHANVIRARGRWIRGLIDPFYFGRADHADPEKMVETYRRCNLFVTEAPRDGVATGIVNTYSLMTEGRLKVFQGMLPQWELELGTYVSNPKTGKPDKSAGVPDDLMDCTRIIVQAGMSVAKSKKQAMAMATRPAMQPYAGPADGFIGY